mmetsp:Transcript_30338/g.68942  ORF Transcript_30338/g.68942 Transcript_30338/m.68942 type:complete len:209 (-) Transcript_30338:35-661(-)
MRMVRWNFGSIWRHLCNVDIVAASAACSTQSMTLFLSLMKPITSSTILSERLCLVESSAKSRKPGRSTICMSTHAGDSIRTWMGTGLTDSPSSSCAAPTSLMTSCTGCSCHWLVLRSRTNQREPRAVMLRNSRTVGLLLPKVPEMKLKVSPASASMSRLFPTDCFPMRMNWGIGKSMMPSLSCTLAFTSPSTLSSSVLEPTPDMADAA